MDRITGRIAVFVALAVASCLVGVWSVGGWRASARARQPQPILYTRYASWYPSAMIEDVWADAESGVVRIRDTYYGADPGIAILSPETTYLVRQPGGAEMRTVGPATLGGKPTLQVTHVPSWNAPATLAQLRAAYAGLPATTGAAARLCAHFGGSRDADIRLLNQAVIWLPSGIPLPGPLCVERDRRTGLPRRLLATSGRLVVFNVIADVPVNDLPSGFLLPPGLPDRDPVSAALRWLRGLVHL